MWEKQKRDEKSETEDRRWDKMTEKQRRWDKMRAKRERKLHQLIAHVNKGGRTVISTRWSAAQNGQEWTERERKECANTREREREERNPPFPRLDLQKEQASPCSQEPHGCRRSLLKSPPENVWDHGPNGTSRAKGAVWACLCVCLRRRGPTLHLCQTERNRESERMSPFQPNHRATESGSGCSPTD